MLLIALKGGAVLFREPLVYGTVLKELKGRCLAVEVICHNLKAAQKQRLAHDVKVTAQGVHNVDAALCGISLKLCIIVLLGERVIHGFREAVGRKEVGDVVTDGLGLRLGTGLDTHPESLGQLNVIVAVDAEDFLNYVALTGNIHHISRGGHKCSGGCFFHKLVVQALKDLLDGAMADLLPYEMLNPVIVQLNHCTADGLGIEFTDLTHNLTTGNSGDEEGGALCGIKCGLGVCATLKAEACVCGESLALGGFADAHGVEVCTLYEHVHGAV